MKAAVLPILLISLLPSDAMARSDCEKIACAAVKEKIRNIESKMRAGYTRAKGERYEAQLRELRTMRYHLCR